MKRLLNIIVATIMFATTISAHPLQEQTETKMNQLRSLIKQANKKKINTLHERTTLRTAEIFTIYADWDAENIDQNIKHFEKTAAYKKVAEKMANELPDFEREEIVKMLNTSIEEIKSVLAGESRRLDSPTIDWGNVEVDDDVITFKGKPVFLSDWTWKPTSPEYTEYYGNLDRFLLNPSSVTESGAIQPSVMKELENKPTGTAGLVFLGHTTVPAWAKRQDPTITEGAGIKYTMYDICNPLAREIQSKLIAGTVPQMAGKNYTQLGYMLCNEPHWVTTEGSYTAGAISERALDVFRNEWLPKQHGTIEALNSVWHTDYKSFDEVESPRMMKKEMQGSALYYDFVSFNMDRVTDWFAFLKSEIQRYDPEGKTHLKIMPDMWSENPKDNGIDLEALTRASEIIGNDASTAGKRAWGPAQAWEKYYSFNWRELCMSYDFMKSVSPNKIIFNSEGHLLTTNTYRNLYDKPEYARSNYWLAHIHGLTAMQTWYWCRREDGSSRGNDVSPGYAGSNNHQPRIVNEVHKTMIDLNSVSEDIIRFQRQRKPIRLFYSKASAINNGTQMDKLFDIYESLYFEGVPIGFATEGILAHNDIDWDVIVVGRTDMVEPSEVEALQGYLDRGGVIIIDKESLKRDEYGRALNKQLTPSKGRIIEVDSWRDMCRESMQLIEQPAVVVDESNGLEQKGCSWRVIEGEKSGSYLISIVNLGKNSANLTLSFRDTSRKVKSVKSVLTEKELTPNLEIGVQGTLYLEVE